jgi:hypothetical protein
VVQSPTQVIQSAEEGKLLILLQILVPEVCKKFKWSNSDAVW